jgi:hypothetical protein
MKYTLLLVVIVAFLSQIAIGQDAAAYNDPEAYAVYSALLEGAKAKRLVIQTETADYPMMGGRESDNCLAPSKGKENIYAPIIAAYRTVNKQKWQLQRKFEIKTPYELAPNTIIDGFFKKGVEGGWKEFYKQYPNSDGFTQLSAVGFNADKTIAIVYLSNSCGGLCGFGTYHVLHKKDGKWTEILGEINSCAWVS